MSKDTDFLSKRFMVNFIYDFEKKYNIPSNIRYTNSRKKLQFSLHINQIRDIYKLFTSFENSKKDIRVFDVDVLDKLCNCFNPKVVYSMLNNQQKDKIRETQGKGFSSLNVLDLFTIALDEEIKDIIGYNTSYVTVSENQKFEIHSYYKEPCCMLEKRHGNDKEITKAIVPDGVTHIGDYVFADCSNLTDITIPPSVNWIGYYAFENCNENLIFHCAPNSFAEKYANGHGYKVEYLDEISIEGKQYVKKAPSTEIITLNGVIYEQKPPMQNQIAKAKQQAQQINTQQRQKSAPFKNKAR